MDDTPRQLIALSELDARHDDLLRRLEELDRRVARALAQYQPIATSLESASEERAGEREALE